MLLPDAVLLVDRIRHTLLPNGRPHRPFPLSDLDQGHGHSRSTTVVPFLGLS